MHHLRLPGVLHFPAILLALFLIGCGKPDSNSQTEAKINNRASASSTAELVSKSGVEMVCLPGGEFIMGSDRGNADEAPAHKVKVTAFLMDKFEVTHDLFTK